MSLSVKFSKWVIAVFLLVALATALFFGSSSKASATINYGEEVSEVAKLYVGAPFKYGGTTPKGFDASGFTQYIYKNAATKLVIPRTSAAQYKIGKPVAKNALQPGDLVFFATGKKGKVSYVAIYNGNGKFTGATSKGVKIVNLSDKYWKDKYVGAKRVIK